MGQYHIMGYETCNARYPEKESSMAVLERERIDVDEFLERNGLNDLWNAPALSSDGTPPGSPPPFDGDDRDDGNHDDGYSYGYGVWGRRIFALIGIVVLLCMIISPIAAVFAGHIVHH